MQIGGAAKNLGVKNVGQEYNPVLLFGLRHSILRIQLEFNMNT